MFQKNLILCLLPLLLITACKAKPSSAEVVAVVSPVQIVMEHAKGVTVDVMDNYRRVVINNPWQPDITLAVYYLVENDTVKVPSDGMKIKVPVTSIAVSSVTQVGFLDELNNTDLITGSCSPELIYQARLREKSENGLITNLGDAFTINVERTMLLQPSVLLMSGYKQDDPYAQRVQQAGIPVVYINEWMEETVLGRAEWIKFMAMLVGKESQADSVFGIIATEYANLHEMVQRVVGWPTVMTGSNFRGTWYMPGGSSYMAKMLQDAGAQYFYETDSTKGSLPLNVETVLNNFASADVWLNCNFNSIDELLAADSKHALFNAVKSGNVYNFNKRLLPSGANDYWESAVVRPDWLLKDLIAILHPQLFPDYELIYHMQLKR